MFFTDLSLLHYTLYVYSINSRKLARINVSKLVVMVADRATSWLALKPLKGFYVDETGESVLFFYVACDVLMFSDRLALVLGHAACEEINIRQYGRRLAGEGRW